MDLQFFAGESHRGRKILKTICRIVLILMLAVLFAAGGIIGYVRLREGKRIVKDEERVGKYDAILVLGCGVYQDGSLSPMLRYRLETVLELYAAGVSDTVYLTGDHRKGEYAEVDHMAEFLQGQGIPEEALMLDYEGYSTGESMAHAGRDLSGKSVLVVTQKYHLYRALYLGEANGLSCAGTAAQDWGLSSGTVYRHLRELAATLKDWAAVTFGLTVK